MDAHETCPSPAAWQQILEAGSPGSAPGDCAQHLESCAHCRAVVAELTEGDRVWFEIAAELRRPAVLPPPACRRALEEVKRRAPAPQPDADVSRGRVAQGTGADSVVEGSLVPARIHIERMMHRNSIAVAGDSAAAYALLKLIPDGPAGAARPVRRNLALALDVSGSMYEQDGTGISRLRRVQDAAIAALQKLRPDDTLAIIGFAHNAQAVLPPTRVVEKSKIEDVIRRIDMFAVDPGGTAMDEGLALAMTDVETHAGAGTLSQIVILTDGETSGEQNCRHLAQKASQKKMHWTLMGVGTEWNAALIKDLARLSEGKWHYIDVSDAHDAARIFDEEFTTLAAAAFLDVELRLRPMKDVHIKRIRQVVPEIQEVKLEGERDPVARLGTLRHDVSSRYIIDLSLPRRPDGKYAVAHLKLTYDLGDGRRESSGQIPLEMTYTAAGQGYVNAEVMKHIDDLQLQAMSDTLQRVLDGNDLQAARQVAQEMEKKGGQMGKRAEKKTMLAKEVLNELNASGRVCKKTQLAMADAIRMAEAPVETESPAGQKPKPPAP